MTFAPPICRLHIEHTFAYAIGMVTTIAPRRSSRTNPPSHRAGKPRNNANPDPELTLLGETHVRTWTPAELATGHRQATLCGAQTPAVDHTVRSNRHEISPGCWVDHRLGWLQGADILFDDMTNAVPFSTYTRPMYDRIVTVPRLSWFGSVTDAELPPVMARIAAALEQDFPGSFQSVGANLYRSGADSVAWHSDRIGRRVKDPVVALVSLGEHRPFAMRPKDGGPSRRFMLGGGDLFVMGGAVQHRWDHAVPKVRHAGPRMSLGFRDPAGIPQQR